MEFLNKFNKAVIDSDVDEIELTPRSGRSKKIDISAPIPSDYIIWLPRDLAESEARSLAAKSPSGKIAVSLETRERRTDEANWSMYAIGTFDEVTDWIEKVSHTPES